MLAIFSIVNLPLYCQNTAYIPNIQHFSTEQGLSHRNVHSIFQDRDGIIWIGTDNGLNRFDGYHFKYFLGKNHGVDLRNIARIGQDDEGWLWLNNNVQLMFFNPTTETFKTIEERFGKDCILEKDVVLHSGIHYVNDNYGRIYIERAETPDLYSYHSSEGFKKIDLPFHSSNYNLKEITDDYEFIFIVYTLKD